MDSMWKVGKKRGWWRGIKGGDVGVFVVGLAVMNSVYEREREAVQGALMRRGLGFLRGEGVGERVEEGEGGNEIKDF